jgi:hypothetical protein
MRAYCIATRMPRKIIGVRSTLISKFSKTQLIGDRSKMN